MTREELKAIRERLNKATLGPWVTDGHSVIVDRVDLYGFMAVICRIPCESESNADFIAHSIADVPKLLDEVERLNADIEQQTGFAQWAEHEAEKLRRALKEIANFENFVEPGQTIDASYTFMDIARTALAEGADNHDT